MTGDYSEAATSKPSVDEAIIEAARESIMAVGLRRTSIAEIARNAGRIVVFCDSHILMQGTPREVFARAEELERVGLDVPQVTKIAG